MKLVISKDILSINWAKFIPLFALLLFAFIPTSSEGEIFGKMWSLILWVTVILFVLLVGIINRIDIVLTIRGLAFVFFYLGLITLYILLTNNFARLSLYRMAPIISLVFLTSIKIENYKLSANYMRKLLDVFFIAMFLWNTLILLQSEYIKEFTINNYSQYYPQALINTFYYNKPVMSFGVHTWSSYFYLIMFYLSYVTAIKTNKIRFYLYCGFVLLFTLLLTSNSSLVYGLVMSVMLFWLLRKKSIFLIIITSIIGIVLINYWDIIWERYVLYLNSDTNGIISRYISEKSSFTNNFKLILSSLGIGFSILDNVKIGYSDSGYIVYLTMGSIPLLVFIYGRLYNFLVRNILSKYVWFIIFIVFSFEFALPATYSYRFPFMIIFVVYYLESLSTNE